MKLSPPQSFGGALEAVECGPEHPFWSLGPQLREAETSMRPTQRVTEPFVDSSQQLFTKPFPRRWRGCRRRSERISPPAPGPVPFPAPAVFQPKASVFNLKAASCWGPADSCRDSEVGILGCLDGWQCSSASCQEAQSYGAGSREE